MRKRKCNMLKRLFTIIILLTLVLSEINLTGFDVYAADYDPATAASWAVQNYNKVSGECAEFVSKCLQAGGCDIGINKRVVNLYTELRGRNEFTEYAMARTANSSELQATGANAGKIAVGESV